MTKIVAIIAMTIDHYGYIFANDVYIYRLIGRISFPLFALLLSYNFIFHTSDRKLYIKRVAIFAFISQPFYLYAFPDIFNLNIFFLFLFSMITFHYQKVKYIIMFFLTSFFVDYSAGGYVLILSLIYIFDLYKRNAINAMQKNIMVSIVLFCTNFFFNSYIFLPAFLFVSVWGFWIDWIERVSSRIFNFYRYKIVKLALYAFYPFHLLLLKVLYLLV